MKKIMLLIVAALLAGSISVAGAEEEVGYQHDVEYPGIYKALRLYQLTEIRNQWIGSPRPKHFKDINCYEAEVALKSGIWVGNLSDSGECLDPMEAPKRATGNHLNYLVQQKRKAYSETGRQN